VHTQRRDRQRDEEPAAHDRGEYGPAKHPLDDPGPHPIRLLASPQVVAQRKPSLLDSISQNGEHRGQDGQRTDHRHRHDEDRSGGQRGERWRAAEVHAAHRDHHGEAGDEDGPTGGGGRRLDRRVVHTPGRALLAHALEVEERVVHAHGQPDQEDHVADRLVDRSEVADRTNQAEGRGHAGDRKQQRHAGGNQRAERQHQDEQRDRHRRRLGLVEVLRE
jgi:hypothetical protein